MHIQILKSINSTPNMLQDDCNDKLPLIIKSITETRIDYTLQGKNLANTPYTWHPEALTYDNHSQVPTRLKSGPCSQDKVLALDLILPPKVKAPHEVGRCGLT
jgi:hypothetical protein